MTWTTCRSSSTTTCLTTAKITCIASGAPGARAAAGARFRSCPGANCFRSATSSATRTRGFSARKIPTVDEVHEAARQRVPRQTPRHAPKRRIQTQDHLIERLLEEGFTSTDIASALIHHLQGGNDARQTPRKKKKGATTAASAVTIGVTNVRPARHKRNAQRSAAIARLDRSNAPERRSAASAGPAKPPVTGIADS